VEPVQRQNVAGGRWPGNATRAHGDLLDASGQCSTRFAKRTRGRRACNRGPARTQFSGGPVSCEGIARRLGLRRGDPDIADNAADDWNYNPDSKKLTIQKEAILRSKIRIEARQFHMSRLHP